MPQNGQRCALARRIGSIGGACPAYGETRLRQGAVSVGSGRQGSRLSTRGRSALGCGLFRLRWGLCTRENTHGTEVNAAQAGWPRIRSWRVLWASSFECCRHYYYDNTFSRAAREGRTFVSFASEGLSRKSKRRPTWLSPRGDSGA